MSEKIPYVHKHSKKIEFQYRGVAADLMYLNDQITDEFMSTSDMRYDIVVSQKIEDRVSDYDQVGNTRIAKYLSLTRLNRIKPSMRVQKQDNAWHIAINDQLLADEVLREDKKDKKFDEAYIEKFQEKFVDGVRNSLMREKILNGEVININFFADYYLGSAINLVIFPSIMGLDLRNGRLDNLPTNLLMLGTLNTAINAMNLLNVAMTKFHRWFSKQLFGRETSPGEILERLVYADYSEPFTKHHLLDYMLPPVPVDKILRGRRYLNKHSKEFIETAK